ncbi:hypothetical protein OfM1_12070 [Lactovum odontotermitis]
MLLAVIFNYTIQRGSSIPNSLLTGAVLFQILVLTSIFMLIYAIINRYVISSLLIIVVFSTFSIANAVKFSEREEPIYLSDVSWLKNPSTLLSFVNISLIIIVAVVFVVICTFAVFIIRKKWFKGKLMSWKARSATLFVFLLVFVPLANIFANYPLPNNLTDSASSGKQIQIPVLTAFVNSDAANLWFGNATVSSRNSLSFVWLKTAFGKIMEEPKSYSQSSIEKIDKKYLQLAGQMNQTRVHEITDQTVIYVLSESLSDPRRVPGVTVSQNPLNNIEKMMQENTGGSMLSNGYGGGTANMEIQSLTGMPMNFFTSSVANINNDVLPRMPFIPSISDEFSDKIALHPENAKNYDRNVIYDRLGFQHFYAMWGTTKEDTLTNQTMLDGRVDDAQTYKDVLDKIDTNKTQFFSVLTMQNHMPYDAYTGDSKITATGVGFDKWTNNQLQNYTRKVSTSDQATQDFLDALKKIDKRITVVFYGDHLPGFYPSDIFNDNPEAQFLTDYFIWTNQGNAKNSHDTLNSAEFTPKLLETTNSKVSPYQALLTEVMQKVPAEFDTRFSGDLKLNAEQKQLISDLKMVQYDLTAGKHYLTAKSSFFKVQ